MSSGPGTLMPMHKAATVHCRACDSIVALSFAYDANGVPLGRCPHCNQPLILRQVGRPDVQRRGL